MSTQRPKRERHLLQNDRRWEKYKGEIHQIYITESNTLSRTMMIMWVKHCFKASTRKWKMKLKDWKFDKNRKKKNPEMVAATAETRSNENRDGAIFHSGCWVPLSKLESCERLSAKNSDGTCPDEGKAQPYMEYCTSGSESGISSQELSIHSCKSVYNVLDTALVTAICMKCCEFWLTNPSFLHTGTMIRAEAALAPSVSGLVDSTPSFDLVNNAADFVVSDSPNLEKQVDFPRLQTQPLDITEASAKEMGSLAATYCNIQDFANAETAYLNAISQYSCLLGYDDLHVCQLRSSLADIQAKLHHLDESISTRRQIVATCWLKYGENAHATVHYTEKLAAVLALQKKNEEAHFLYRKAADGYQNASEPGSRLRCLTRIIQLFLESGCEGEALPILHSTLVGYLSLLNGDHTIWTEVRNTIALLRDVYLQLGPKTTWKKVVVKLSHMESLVETESVLSSSPVPKVICEAINLAHIFSKLREFDKADSLFQLGLARFELAPRSMAVCFIKATIHHCYANHLSRKGDIIGSAEFLVDAFRNLNSVGPGGDELATKIQSELEGSILALDHYPTREAHKMRQKIRTEIFLMPPDDPKDYGML